MAALFIDRSKLNFDNLLTSFKDNVSNMVDQRAANTSYSLEDICLSTLSMFYSQDPSFLAFQQRMKERSNLCNANTIFGIKDIPSDNQIRNVLDNINPSQLDDFFEEVIDLIDNNGYLNRFRYLKDQLLIAMDGTNCYHSINVHCDNCLIKTHKKGSIRLITGERINITKEAIKEGKEIVIFKNKDQQLKLIYKKRGTNFIDEIYIESNLFSSLDFNGNILYRNEETEQIYQFIYDLIIANKGHVTYRKNNKKDSNINNVEYYHSILTPIIASPNQTQIISLSPEHITNLDGSEKQDCERNAAKRWLEKHGNKYGQLKATILGDDLYCCESICKEVLNKDLHFIFVCKDSSHKSLYEFINSPIIESELVQTKKEKIIVKKKEVTNIYRYMNNVPLTKMNNSFRVNWFEITTISADGSQLFYSTYITDHVINNDNIAELVVAARSRWKVENENNNTLKTKGYNMEHSYGHGKQYLAMFLATLNIIAFLFHSVLELYDDGYQKIRKHFGARARLFDYIKYTLMQFLFKGWEDFVRYSLELFRINKVELENSA